jgi:hypothetical protein
MSWHADDEKELDPKGQIASLSLGASRDFCFKHKESTTKKNLATGKRKPLGHERWHTKTLASQLAQTQKNQNPAHQPDFSKHS